MRHILGSQYYKADRGYFRSISDAQKVLDEFHAGNARIIGLSYNGNVFIRVNGVTGYNVNANKGIFNQPTNVFMIKGTAHPAVVPTNPGAVGR